MSTNTGGQAFPGIEIVEYGSGPRAEHHVGMTLRDYFAAKALPALINAAFTQDVSSKAGGTVTEEVIAKQAYHFADAMLAARGAV